MLGRFQREVTSRKRKNGIYRACLCALGYNQVPGLDYTDNLTAGNGRQGKSNQYGVQYTVGAASVYAITGKATVDSPTARVNDITNTQYGVRYNLSKRTMAYFMAGESKDSAPTAADKMSKGKMNGVGVMHAF